MSVATAAEPVQSEPAVDGAVAVSLAPAIPPDLPMFRFSVEQYHELFRLGMLGDDPNLELLDGWIVPKMTKNPPHAFAYRELRKRIQSLLPQEWDLVLQDPITLSRSEPEPDIAVFRGTPRDFLERHPHAGEIGLIVEVADDSLSRDRLKRHLYAHDGIAIYWIVNLRDRVIEVYSEPDPATDGYAARHEYVVGQSAPLVLEGKRLGDIGVADVMP